MKWYKLNINEMTKSEYDEFFNLMTEKKRERVERFKNAEDKKLCVCGEMLAKNAVSRESGIAAADLVFETEKSGKPFCKNADVEFSISHSGEYAVCAVSDRPVGIDIQKIVPYNEKTAERVCSGEEIVKIIKSQNKSKEFIKIWTQKEAVLKRDGKSIFDSDIKTCLNGKNVQTIEFSDYFVSVYE